jgi:alpha-L-fucosidase
MLCLPLFHREAAGAAAVRSETKPQRDARMKWWREARFGMFIHWGLYAVPAGEYKGQRSKRIGEWIMEWANIPRAEYEKFARNSTRSSSTRLNGSESRKTRG